MFGRSDVLAFCDQKCGFFALFGILGKGCGTEKGVHFGLEQECGFLCHFGRRGKRASSLRF